MQSLLLLFQESTYLVNSLILFPLRIIQYRLFILPELFLEFHEWSKYWYFKLSATLQHFLEDKIYKWTASFHLKYILWLARKKFNAELATEHPYLRKSYTTTIADDSKEAQCPQNSRILRQRTRTEFWTGLLQWDEPTTPLSSVLLEAEDHCINLCRIKKGH